MLAGALFFALLSSTGGVEARLHRELAAVDGVRFGRDEETFTVKYRTEVVLVPASKARLKLEERRPEERPTARGFILETYEFSHRDTDPPRPEQAARMNANWLRDYGSWKMDAVERQVDGENKVRYYYLAWGSKVDSRLIARIRAAVERGSHAMIAAARN